MAEGLTFEDLGLNEMQKRFVEFFVGCGVATEAAKKAGYSQPEMAGSRAMKNAKVAIAISRASKAATTERIADAIERRMILTKILRGELKQKKLLKDGSVAEIVDIDQIIKAAQVMAAMDGAKVQMSAEVAYVQAPTQKEMEEDDGSVCLDSNGKTADCPP